MKKLFLLLFIICLENSLFAHHNEPYQGTRARSGMVWARDPYEHNDPYEHPVGSLPDTKPESPIYRSMRGQSADFEAGMYKAPTVNYRRPVTPVFAE